MDFARAAIDGEQLGQRGVTDAIAISVSGTDLAGHLFGPYSHEYQDMVLRFDRAVEKLLQDLERSSSPVSLSSPSLPTTVRRRFPKKRCKKPARGSGSQRHREGHGPKGTVAVLLDTRRVGRGAGRSQRLHFAQDDRAGEGRSGASRRSGRACRAGGVIGYFTRTQLMRGWMPPTDVSTAVVRSYFRRAAASWCW